MPRERDELLDHDYDGIKEYDNPLPRWWLGLFYATILFAVVYTPYMLLGFGPSSAEEYQQEMQAAAKMYPRLAASQMPGITPAQPGAAAGGGATAPAAPPAALNLKGDPQAIAAGKAIFAANCAPCHGPQAQGVIGPNLTDDYWLHGDTYAEIVHTITNGVPDKGMISWKNTLNPTKIAQVAAFVMSLKGSNPPNPKPPQGKKYSD